MSYAISELNGVKIYNLSAGKTLNQFLEEAAKKKKSLRYDQEYRKRIELIQDFDFPVASGRVKISPDQRYIIASGIYSPQIKIFETAELGMKCMRGIDSEVVNFQILGQDYSKLALICADRSVEFHAQYGRHYKTRVPKFPRDLIFNPNSSDLMICGSSEEIYRISLDEGKFLSSLQSDSKEVNAMNYNPYLNVVMTGGMEGIIETWDYRERKKINKVIANNGAEITKLQHDSSGFLFCAGSDNGLVRLYDLRYASHILEVQHHYKLPIKSIQFHEGSKNIISADRKIIKFYNKNTGKIFTNIEPKVDINDIEIIGDSGLILAAHEDVRIGQYFIPELGPAPKWCPFLENITEELEEELNSTVYDEYKFLTSEDIEALNGTHLIGTKMLKRYMHGYMMHIKMYNKLKDIHDPFAYEKYRKERITKKLEEDRQNRITLPKKKPKVNQEFIEEIENKSDKRKKKFSANELLKDPRFATLFTREEFKIDKNSENFKLNNPSNNKNRKKNDEDSFGEEDDKVEENHSDKDDNDRFNLIEEYKKKEKMNFEERIKEKNEAEMKNINRNLKHKPYKKYKKL